LIFEVENAGQLSVGVEDLHGMRLEGHDDRRDAGSLGHRNDAVEENLMTEVDAVEVSDRENRRGKGLTQFANAV
jgi:hypothetical protein